MTKQKGRQVDVISFSLPEELAAKVDSVMEEIGYQNRSEVIRDAIRVFLDKHQGLHQIQGFAEGVAMVIYSRQGEKEVHSSLHDNPDIFTSFLHLDFGESRPKCCDVVVFKGEARRLRQVFHLIESTSHVERLDVALL